MKARSAGVKRIAVIFSVVSVLVWIIFAFWVWGTQGFQSIPTEVWMIFAIGIVVAIFVPQLILKGAYWVIDGFNKDKET